MYSIQTEYTQRNLRKKYISKFKFCDFFLTYKGGNNNTSVTSLENLA